MLLIGLSLPLCHERDAALRLKSTTSSKVNRTERPMSHIEAAALTTLEVAPDGTRFQMNMLDQDGKSASVSLPTQCINELMMTLPNVLRRALSNQFRDSSLRLVYRLGQTRFEKVAG